MTLARMRFATTSTIRIQNVVMNSLGQVESAMTQSMLVVTHQLFTTMMWNSVTIDMPKSLKFIK